MKEWAGEWPLGQYRNDTPAGDAAGRYCSNCDLLLCAEAIICPQGNQKTRKVDLWEKLPGFALRRGVRLEVAHGQAASLLWRYDGMSGLLEPTPH
jgi:hypothetical protein